MRTELVGREAELALLADSLAAALDGLPQVVVCEGEAGIGKTRLAQELVGWRSGAASSGFGGRPPRPPARRRSGRGARCCGRSRAALICRPSPTSIVSRPSWPVLPPTWFWPSHQ